MQQEDLDVPNHIPSDDRVVKFSYHSYIPHNTSTINEDFVPYKKTFK